MTTLYENAVPIINLPFYYINGFNIFNDATTPNTLLDVKAGICRDSTNTYDMNLGNYNGQVNPSSTANVTTVINAAVNGLNGLDAGTFAASTFYYVYVVSDPVSGNSSGAMISTSVPATGPLMPFGYSAFRHVGSWATDSSVHFLLGYVSGNNNARIFTYDAPQATSITAGHATSYTAVDLSALVPLPIANQNIPVNIAYDLLPGNAAGDVLKLQGAASTGDAVTITGQITTVHVTGNAIVQAQLASSKPEIKYLVTNASDTAVLKVAGYYYYI